MSPLYENYNTKRFKQFKTEKNSKCLSQNSQTTSRKILKSERGSVSTIENNAKQAGLTRSLIFNSLDFSTKVKNSGVRKSTKRSKNASTSGY